MSDFSLYFIAALLALNFLMHVLAERDRRLSDERDERPRPPVKKRGTAPKTRRT